MRAMLQHRRVQPVPHLRRPGADQRMICVVEDPLDVLAVERTGAFRGVYHILHGVPSPIDGVYPEKLRIAELVNLARQTHPREVNLATNPSLEGDTTALYLQNSSPWRRQRHPPGARSARRRRSGIHR